MSTIEEVNNMSWRHGQEHHELQVLRRELQEQMLYSSFWAHYLKLIIVGVLLTSLGFA